ncbi:MAG: hypothetical protein ACRDTD_16255 [Pseudonocardiaceae bacterium]
MSTEKEPNRLLAAVMAEAGVSNKGLAARVRARAARDGHSISSDHVFGAQVACRQHAPGGGRLSTLRWFSAPSWDGG